MLKLPISILFLLIISHSYLVHGLVQTKTQLQNETQTRPNLQENNQALEKFKNTESSSQKPVKNNTHLLYSLPGQWRSSVPLGRQKKHLSLSRLSMDITPQYTDSFLLEISTFIPVYSSYLIKVPSVNFQSKLTLTNSPFSVTTGLTYFDLSALENSRARLFILPINANYRIGDFSTKGINKSSSIINYLEVHLDLPLLLSPNSLIIESSDPISGSWISSYLRTGISYTYGTRKNLWQTKLWFLPTAFGKVNIQGSFDDTNFEAQANIASFQPLGFGLSAEFDYIRHNDNFYYSLGLMAGNSAVPEIGLFLPQWDTLNIYKIYVAPKINIGVTF